MYMAFTPIITPCDCDIRELPERSGSLAVEKTTMLAGYRLTESLHIVHAVWNCSGQANRLLCVAAQVSDRPNVCYFVCI